MHVRARASSACNDVPAVDCRSLVQHKRSLAHAGCGSCDDPDAPLPLVEALRAAALSRMMDTKPARRAAGSAACGRDVIVHPIR